MLPINSIKYIFIAQRSTIASVHLVKMEELATKCLGNTTVPVLTVLMASTVKQVYLLPIDKRTFDSITN